MATPQHASRGGMTGWRGALYRAIPTSSSLTDESFLTRHRAILVIAALHVVGVPLFAIWQGRTWRQALIETAPISLFSLIGVLPLHRRIRAAAVTVALMLSSAVLLHLSGGASIWVLHFFVMVPIVALYQDWLPFGIAVSFVLLHHGIVGTIDPRLIYDDPRAWESPWRFAAARAGFLGALGAVCIVGWRINEAVLERQRMAERELVEEKRIVETLHSIGTGVVSELDIDRVSQLVTDAAVAATGAAFGAFFYNVQDPGGESYMLYTVSGVERSAFEQFPLPRNTKIFGPTFAGTAVIRSEDITRDERYGQNAPYNGMPPGHLPLRSYMAVPVRSRGSSEVLGGLFFGHPEPGMFDERHERIAVGIATQAAIAFDNARLYQAEREAYEAAEQARARVSMLADVGRVLVSTLDPAKAVENLVRATVPTFADVSIVDLRAPDGSIERIDVTASPGLEEYLDVLRSHPPDPTNDEHAVVQILNGAESIFRTSEDGDRLERTARTPEHADVLRRMQVTSAVFVPLVGQSEILGAVSYLTVAGSGRRFVDEDIPLAEALGRRAGMAVENARLYQAERTARAEADKATASLSLLAEAGRLSATPLDEDVRVQQLANVTVPALADACLIDVVEPDGSIRRVAAAATGYEAFAEEITRFPPDANDTEHSVISVIGGGPSVVVEEIDPSFLETVTRGEDHVSVVISARPSSTVIVPLSARGGVYGALSLIDFEDSERRLTWEDLPLAEEIGRRAGVAVHNARMYRTEREALASAEAATTRVSLLADASRVLASSLDIDTTLRNVAKLVVPTLADVCTIDVLTSDKTIRRVATARAEGLDEVEDVIRDMKPPSLADVDHPIVRVLRGDKTQHHTDIDLSTVPPVRADPDRAEKIARLAPTSSLIVPLRGQKDVVGTVTFATTARSGRQIPKADIALAEEIGRRAGIAIENARLYAQQRSVAESLQHALLPQDLPTIPGFEVTARYQPGGPDERVGGDWYDVFEVPTGALAIVMGDVVGHGIPAASLMAQLRNALRAYVWDGLEPGEVLSRLNQFLYGLEREGMASASLGLLNPITSTMRIANAGHPPFLCLSETGDARFIGEGLGPPLGAIPFATYREETVAIAAGDTLVFYTDGLVEDRVSSLDEGLRLMREAAMKHYDGVDELCDGIIEACIGGRVAEDDVAVLVLRALRMGTRLQMRLPAEPRILASLRQTVRRWLREQGVADDEVQEVLVATGEACNNAIEHGAAPLGGWFEIEAMMDGELHVVVKSTGDWRAPRRDGGGRGLPVIESLMDHVEIDRSGEGVEIRMRRKIDKPKAGSRS